MTALAVEFTAADLAGLRPGEVRRRAGVDAYGERAYVVEGEDEFAANACAELRS